MQIQDTLEGLRLHIEMMPPQDLEIIQKLCSLMQQKQCERSVQSQLVFMNPSHILQETHVSELLGFCLQLHAEYVIASKHHSIAFA